MTLPPKTISIKTNLKDHPFVLFQSDKQDFNSVSKDLLKNSFCVKNVRKVFFHPKNILILQKRLIKEVYLRSNHKYLIQKQKEGDLILVMDSIFSDYEAKINACSEVKNLIEELDLIVIDTIVPGVIFEIESYLRYLDARFGQRELLDRGVNSSSKGLKHKI